MFGKEFLELGGQVGGEVLFADFLGVGFDEFGLWGGLEEFLELLLEVGVYILCSWG